MEEIWKPVPGYEKFYEISSLGAVKSLARHVDKKDGGYLTLKEKILQPSASQGKLQVILSKSNRRKSHKVHLLVLSAFHGERPEGEQVIFKNGNRQDVRAANLMWGQPDQTEHILTAMAKLMAKMPPGKTLHQPEAV